MFLFFFQHFFRKAKVKYILLVFIIFDSDLGKKTKGGKGKKRERDRSSNILLL